MNCARCFGSPVYSLVLFSVLVAAASAEKAPVPPPLTEYMGRRIAKTMHYKGAPWLVRESREREEDCKTLLRELHLKPGQTIAGVGCGNGFYTLQLAQRVAPGGKVLAVDIQPEMLDLLRRRAGKAHLDNIVPVLGQVYDPHLPRGQVDLVLLVDVYHEFSHPVHMLRAIRDSLSPEGVVAIAEFRMEDPKVPIKPLHKMSKAQVLREFGANGFKLVRQFDGLPWQHLLFFARDDGKSRNGSES